MVKMKDAFVKAVEGKYVDTDQWTQGTWNNLCAVIESSVRMQGIDWGF